MVTLADAGAPPAPVLVAVDAPAAQRRPTVALRLLLCVPHLLALIVLGAAALVVAVSGWLAALVLGRLPPYAARFLSQYLRWQTRVLAYLFLLTDAYPPFSLHDTAYPVRVTTQPGALNRWAVALRLLLAVPALLVAATVTYGTGTVVLVVTWAVVLVTGRLPAPVHEAYAALVRYTARLQGYLFMVTSQYPWGLLGDVAPAPAPLWPAAVPSPTDDPYWRVVLTARAKNFVVLCLVLGVASVVVVNITTAVARYDRLQNVEMASSRVHDAYQTLSGAVIRYQSRTNSCESSAQPLPCLTGAAHSVAQAFNAFGQRLSTTMVPAVAVSAKSVLVADSGRAERDFDQLSASTTAGRYQLVIESSNLSQLLIRFDGDYGQLGTRLSSVG
jgi:hypothetical protein